MEENYPEGDLGPIFSSATPLTLPVATQLLRKKREGMEEGDRARALIQSCHEQAEMMQETCTTEQVCAALRGLRLRVRTDGAGATNAHLANLIIDADGNAVMPDVTDGPAAAASPKSRLKEFEVVALSSLVPKTATEAVVLIPSLSRYEMGDLHEAVSMVNS